MKSENLLKEPVLLYAASIFLSLAVWQILGMSTSELFLPTPLEVLREFPSLVQSGQLGSATLSTLYIFLVGLGLGLIVGVPGGILLGNFNMINLLAYIPVTILYSMPFVALIPLLIIWTGLGVTTKIILVFIASVFPILINTQTGIHLANPRLIEMARSFGARKREILTDVSIPFSVPHIMAGVRIAVGRAIVGAVVAELTTAISGLGGLIQFYGNEFATAKMMVPLVMVAIISLALTYVARFVENRFERWRFT